MGERRHRSGEAGERIAARFLRKKGYRILQRNYACPAGEMDLIALNGGRIVFVEVKSRESDAFGPPESRVNRAKQGRLSRVALEYLRRHNLHDASCRFDVVSILHPASRDPVIEHFQEAFPLRIGRY